MLCHFCPFFLQCVLTIEQIVKLFFTVWYGQKRRYIKCMYLYPFTFITLVFPHCVQLYEILTGRGPLTRVEYEFEKVAIFSLKTINDVVLESKRLSVVIVTQ